MPAAVAYSNFRKDLKTYMRRVNENAEALLVTSSDPSCNVVVIGADDYDALVETARVYENPYLRDKVAKGLAEMQAGRAVPHELAEDDVAAGA